jgi:hypothetical protein
MLGRRFRFDVGAPFPFGRVRVGDLRFRYAVRALGFRSQVVRQLG